MSLCVYKDTPWLLSVLPGLLEDDLRAGMVIWIHLVTRAQHEDAFWGISVYVES